MNARAAPTLRITAAILAAALGIWVGARLHAGRAGPSPSTVMRVPVGEASPPAPHDAGSGMDEVDPPMPLAAKIPARLPDFSLNDPAGKTIPIAAWGGKSLILNFWATWCAPCRREIPLLETLYGEWAGRDIQVVGIAVDHRDDVVAYADKLKIPYPLLLGEQDALDVAARLGVSSPVFPFTVFTDRRGDIVTLYVGELHRPQADLILSAVQNLNASRVGLAEARHDIAAGLQALAAKHPS